MSAAGYLILVIVSANAEWRVVRGEFGAPPPGAAARTPFGEFYERIVAGQRVVLMHGGWGKVDAAASAQYGIARWKPAAVINLGTCGGMAGAIARYDIVLADRTVVYDIVERMGDSAEAIRDYTTAIDLAWLPASVPHAVRRGTLVSADEDLDPANIARLRQSYDAAAADWESGAIARVAARNRIRRILILRGVTDLVGEQSGGEAYGKPGVFEAGTVVVMKRLLAALPEWVKLAASSAPGR